jgi:tetratricopeptide (TPR) repeat protein|nr:hypothetical protein [Kofleriaceae bacterium]
MTRAGATAFALVVAATTAAFAQARDMSPEAKLHFNRALGLYKSGDYRAAIDEISRGRAIDPHPYFDYALGKVYVKLGDCKRARKATTAYLDSHPSASDEADARSTLEHCVSAKRTTDSPSELDAPAAATESPTLPDHASAPVADASTTRSAPRREEPSRWYSDTAGGLLAGAGVAGFAIGAAYLALAEQDISAANSATTVAALQAKAADGQHERTLGTIGLIAGGALAAAAIVRYTMVAREHREPARTVSIAIDPSHGGSAYAVWSGRF